MTEGSYSLADRLVIPPVPPYAGFISTLKRIPRHLPVVGFFLLLCWFAHFSQSRNMGLYEDDHYFVVPTFTWTFGDACQFVWDQIRLFPQPQGRPVGFIAGGILPYVGFHLGGMEGMFVLGWLILSANAVLFYLLLRKAGPAPLPMIGAIAFVFYPADTTRPFLCHAHILQASVTFMLLACNLYVNGSPLRRIAAYGVALLSLLTYETALLPFVVVPLLERNWNLRWLVRSILHGVTLALMAATLFAVRKWLGEARTVNASTSGGTIVHQILEGTRIGISTSIGACQTRVYQGLGDALRWHWLWPTLFAVGAFIVLAVVVSTVRLSLKPRDFRQQLKSFSRRAAGRVALFGVFTVLISYVFCFTHFPPDISDGRLTSTHLAATFGISTLTAVLFSLPMIAQPRVRTLGLTACIAAGYFTLLYPTASDEQAEYVNIWNTRKTFWTQVFRLCPDTTERTLIVVTGPLPVPGYAIATYSWSDYMVFAQAFQLPVTNIRDPMLFVFRPPDGDEDIWKPGIVYKPDGRFMWEDRPFGLGEKSRVFEENLILLHVDDNNVVTRQTGQITLAGHPFPLRPLPPPSMTSPYPTKPLYDLLVAK